MRELKTMTTFSVQLNITIVDYHLNVALLPNIFVFFTSK